MSLQRPSIIQKAVLAISGLVAVHFLFFRAPSEAEMIAKFHRHKPQFEQIRLMLRQDENVETIGSNWVTARWGKKGDLPHKVTGGRLALYRSRLSELGFSRVDSREGRVHFAEFGGGFTDTTWGIGYFWARDTPSPLVESAYNQRPMRDEWHFSRIEGNWYIYHRR